MATKLKKQILNEVESTDTLLKIVDINMWSQLIFQNFDDVEILKASQIVKTKIDGFGPKSLSKAPISLLRKKTLEKLNALVEPGVFIKNFYKIIIIKYKHIKEHDELIWMLCSEENSVSPGEQIFSLAILFPEFFLQEEEKIKHNLENKNKPLYDLVISPTYQKNIEMVLKPHFKEVLYPQILKLLDHKYEENDLYSSVENGTEDLMQLIQIPELNNLGHYLLLAYVGQEQWKKWGEGDQVALLRLVKYDSSKLLLQTKIENENLENQLLIEIEKCENLQRDSDKEKTLWEKELEDNLLQIKNLSENLIDMKSELQKQKEHSKSEPTLLQKFEDNDNELLINEGDVRIVTFNKDLDLSSYFPKKQLIHISNNDQLETLLDDSHSNDLLWFIDTEGCNTKMTFILEQILRKHRISYRFISGDLKSLIRKIIFYLEGENVYETN